MRGVYKIENLINGKKYIGKSENIQHRFRNHKSESFNPKSNAYDTAIHRAIRKYGLENFSFDVIEECETEELNAREIYWIDYYQSFGNGYNMTKGGEGTYAIDIERAKNLWDDGLSIEEISIIMQHTKHTIINALTSYETYSNKESYRRGRENARKKMNKPVLQYDKHGNFIKRYNSITEAANEIKTAHANISGALNRKQKTAGGYQWTYDGEEPPSIYTPQTTNDKKPVLQFNLQNEFVKEYKSLAEAKRAVGLKHVYSISTACNNPTRTAAGFYWRWKDEMSDQ